MILNKTKYLSGAGTKKMGGMLLYDAANASPREKNHVPQIIVTELCILRGGVAEKGSCGEDILHQKVFIKIGKPGSWLGLHSEPKPDE